MKETKHRGVTDPTMRELDELTRRVEQGDWAAMAPLRAWLAEHHTTWAGLSERAARLIEGQLLVLAGDDPQVRAMVEDRLAQAKGLCGFHEASGLERLVLERLLTASLDAMLAEILLSQIDTADHVQAAYLANRLKQANRRMSDTAKQTMLLRKLINEQEQKENPA
jgi:hypothetical protein